jgi:hypothetical protein
MTPAAVERQLDAPLRDDVDATPRERAATVRIIRARAIPR